VAVQIALRWASCVTAASPLIIAEAAAMGVAAEQIVLGVDLDKWPVLPPRPRDPSGPSRLLHVASLNRVKDQGTLLRAMARLRDAGERFHLDIVGQDTLHGAVQELAHSFDLDEFLTFHGFLPHSQLRPLFEAADLMVMSSLHEGGEVVTLEAAIAGVPMVGTRVGHTAAWAPDGAVAVPVGDDAELAWAIRGVLSDESARQRLAREAQRLAVENDVNATADRVNALYRRLTDANRD
jgi:glycosyltransferase involved in cell wall biosynthesis